MAARKLLREHDKGCMWCQMAGTAIHRCGVGRHLLRDVIRLRGGREGAHRR